jgi:hypothetical protein
MVVSIVFSVLLARVAASSPPAPYYPDKYTVSMTLHPKGGFVLEAYDYTSRKQLFWYTETGRTLLNRFDMGTSFDYDTNSCNVTKLDATSMQKPNFLQSFVFDGNATVDSPNFPVPVPCYVWRDPSPPVVVVYTAVKNGNPVKLTVGSPVTRFNYYHSLHQVVEFNQAIFDVPKVCTK